MKGMRHKRLYRVKHTRADGWLSELVSMDYEDEPFDCVHTYLVSVNPGKVRANHYHKKKEEWITITAGRIALFLKDVISGEVDKIIMDKNSEKHEIIYIPTFVAHAVQNITNTEASLIVFSKTPEDKEDTIPYEVLNDPIWTSID